MGAHLINGGFQSLWEYSLWHRAVETEFSDSLEVALRNAGFVPDYKFVAAPLHFLGMLGYTPCGEPCHRLGYDCERRFTAHSAVFLAAVAAGVACSGCRIGGAFKS